MVGKTSKLLNNCPDLYYPVITVNGYMLGIGGFENFKESFKLENFNENAYRITAQMPLCASISTHFFSQIRPTEDSIKQWHYGAELGLPLDKFSIEQDVSGSAIDGILGQGTTIDLYFAQNWFINRVDVHTS